MDLKELLEQEAEPGLGNGGLGGLRPAIWTPSPLWKFPQSATASATNSESLARRFAMAGRLKVADKWLRLGDPGNCVVRRQLSM